MNAPDITRHRLLSQYIEGRRFRTPGDVVQWLGAVQAQDYAASLWAVGVRMREATERAVESALANKKIIRTWPMRGTLHFVSPSDVRWMLKYLTPRMVARGALRFRQLELDPTTFSKSRRIFSKSLEGGKRLTRDEAYELLEKNCISCKGQRGIHILWRLAQEGLICHGPRTGKQTTFVLLDEWVPVMPTISRDEALAQLARRYFLSHGPATLQDFAWWSGLTAADAQESLDAVRSSIASETIGNKTYWFADEDASTSRSGPGAHLLPAFDEFLVGYTDRSDAIDQKYAKRMHPGGGILNATFVAGGLIRGTWTRTMKQNHFELRIKPFESMKRIQRDTLKKAIVRYGRFLGMPVTFVVDH